MISKTVLKVKICEKNEGMLLICRIPIFKNTSVLWINVAWMNVIALKMFLQASIINDGKWAIPKLFIA